MNLLLDDCIIQIILVISLGLFFNLLVEILLIARKVNRCFSLINHRELFVLIKYTGCLVQKACANPKEVFRLRIFGRNKLLVI